MARNVKSPSSILKFTHLWKPDNYNPQKSVYSVHGQYDEASYKNLIDNIKTFLNASSIEEKDDFVLFNNNLKLFRKKPNHPKNETKHYLVKAQCKDKLELPEGIKEQRPFIVDKSGNDIPRDTELEGGVGMIVSKPTPFPKIGVISNVLKGVVIYGFPKAQEVKEVIDSEELVSEVINDSEQTAH